MCKTDTNGFSYIDMDAYSTPPITIEIKKKCGGNHPIEGIEDPCKADKSHTDAFNAVHAATDGTIDDKTVGHFL